MDHQQPLATVARPRRPEDLRQAGRACRQALQANPFDLEALRALAAICQDLGQLDEAAECYQEVLKLRPDDAEAWRLLGNARYLSGRLDEADACYRRTLQLKPNDADAHNNLGAALADRGRLDEAIDRYRDALRLRPDFADAHYNHGNALRDQGRPEEAAACYGRALRLRPEFAEAHNNLGVTLHRQGRHAEAMTSYRQALRLRPNDHHALTGLGLSLAESGRLVEALAHYDQALRLVPDSPEAHRNRSLVRLLLGDMEGGWPDYEHRWRCADFKPLNIPRPYWDGAPLAGRTILLYTEQGSGDTFLFLRFLRPVKERGGVIILAAPESLHPLLSTCPEIDRLVPRETVVPDFDVHCPLMSLPRVLGTTLATLPAAVPYLRAEPDRVARWRGELESVSGFKVGIAWGGSPGNPHDRARSIPVRQFEALARIEGVRLFSLQLGPPAERLRELARDFPVTDLGPRLASDLGSFREAAAVLSSLDLLVSCDTSLVHLAGALALPAWVPLTYVPDWRWLLDRDDSPWYPTLRLFRQHVPGHWDEPFARIAEALKGRISSLSNDMLTPS